LLHKNKAYLQAEELDFMRDAYDTSAMPVSAKKKDQKLKKVSKISVSI
jgi:hypothetical protein